MSTRIPTRIVYSAGLLAVIALSGCQATKCNTCQSSSDIACAIANTRGPHCDNATRACDDCAPAHSDNAKQEPTLPPVNNDPESPPAPKRKTEKRASEENNQKPNTA